MATEEARPDPTLLRGRTLPFGALGLLALAACVAVGLWLRLRGLAAEGFSDDEVHKWAAALRYLKGDFGGDDVEHPMLMKTLIALATAALGDLSPSSVPRGALAMEALTRLPSAVAGALTAVPVALLGRRLFGRAVGLLAAGLLALSNTAVGYHRIAKEDVLLTLFFTLCVWCLAEARAAAEDGRDADRGRWERWSAVSLGAAFASKYFLFYFPLPVFAYLWLRPVSVWRVPLRRWLTLVGLAALVFFALDWVALLPSTWDYVRRYVGGEPIGGDRGVSESIVFMGRLYGNLGPGQGDHPPWWYFPLFLLVKLAPPAALLGYGGVALAALRRRPAHRILLAWLGVFLLFSFIAGAKYARFAIFALPPFLLLAAHAGAEAARLVAAALPRLPRAVPAAAVALALLVPEARAAVTHAPHHKLYVSWLGGGDARVTQAFPHCDLWDAGVREALRWVAKRAEPGAEVASEVDWTVRLYAAEAGRQDLVSRFTFEDKACLEQRPCYVLVQPGRLYRHNERAVRHLANRTPVHVEHVRGHEAVRVYRLEPGEKLFPTAR